MLDRPTLVILATLAMTVPAAAHPHVWVTMRSDVLFNDANQISGIGVEWTFDDGYAQVALDGLDANGDGVYSPSELAPLTGRTSLPSRSTTTSSRRA